MCQVQRAIILLLLHFTLDLALSKDVAIIFPLDDNNDVYVYCGNETDISCSELNIPKLPTGINGGVGIYEEYLGLLGKN